MKYLWVLFFLMSFSATAQHRSQGRDSLPANTPRIGKIFGSIREEGSNLPVSYASIAVLSIRDSALVGGGQTNENGNFLIDDLPPGRFILKISFVGYTTLYSEPLNLSFQNAETDAGILKMKTTNTQLQNVTVTGEKSEMVSSIDRKIYNVSKNIVNTGGTVTEVLQNIPSVTVDADGKVSLRGSENVTILIDGKPSGLMGGDRKAVLQQIPAGAVEQIEVVTNPSAKYDADGMAGIINIRTKKEKMKGINAVVSAGVGTNDKYNLNLSGNNRSPRTNVYLNYSFRHETRSNTSETTQYNFFPLQQSYSYISSGYNSSTNEIHTGKIGADFFINKYNTAGISTSVSRRTEDNPQFIEYTFRYADNSVFNYFYKSNQNDEKNFNYDVNADYKHTWENSKRELTASAGYSSNDKNEKSEFLNSLFLFDNVPYQRSENDNLFSSVVVQSDFIQPVKSTGKFESGVKSTHRHIDNTQNFLNYDTLSNLYIFYPVNSDQFIFDELIAAAYAMYTGKWKKFDFSAGVRAEQTFSEVDSRVIDSAYQKDYLSFFPSAFLRYTLKNSNEIQLSYSRRVNRPDVRTLNPFVDYSDSLNIRRGNPFLNPEYINSFELSYSKIISSWNLSASLYYRHTDDLISRYRTVDSLSGVATMTSVNFSSSDNRGAEAIIRYNFEKAGSVMASFNIYKNKINAKNVSPDLQTDATQWMSRLNINMRISKRATVQFTGNYSAPMTTVNGKIRGMSGADAGLKYDIFKGKGSLSVNVSDIFYTRQFHFENFGEFYSTTGDRRRESRVAMFNFTYNFGKADANLFQRKKNARQREESPAEIIDY
jgi:outer membrane receptor protein involved in Fe transport